MASMFQTLFRTRSSKPSSEIARYNLDWYIQQVLNNPLGVYGTYATTTRDGKPIEDVEASFTGYVQQGYKANGPIFAIVLARLMLFSEARFQFRRLINGRPGDLFGTKALELLENPWPNGTTGELLARMEQDVSLAGNAYVVNEGNRLRRLRPDWVSIVLTGDPATDASVDVAGYVYRPGGYGEPVPYVPEEICHWSPIPDPEAQYRGMSWVTPIVRELQADDSATRHKDAFFRNGAKPGLVVSLKESVKKDQFLSLVKAMNESHQGADQAYKTLFLAGGADVTVAGANMQQLEFRATQGAGETRMCAAGGVPPIIVGLSEGLSSATYSNYAMARRKFGDHWARPQWRSACAALSVLIDVPGGAELWYDDRDISFLREDQKDAAEIAQVRASTINSYITNGFTPESAVAAVMNSDESMLIHTGLVSVQLQPPGGGVPETDPALAGETPPPGEEPTADGTGDYIDAEEAPLALPSAETARSLVGEVDEPDDDLDVDSLALVIALEEYAAEVSRAWDASKHPRIPKGQPGAGRFLSMVDRLKGSIDQHFNGSLAGHPFDDYGREQLRRVAKARGIRLDRGESRDSIAAKLLDDIEPPERRAERRRIADDFAAKAAAAAPAMAKPTSTPTRMTKGQYTKLLKDEHVRLQILDGKSEKDAKAAARPAATIDDLKARNAELRRSLRDRGIDYRTEEQRREDDAAKDALLDEVQRLASAGGHDGPAKRAAAAKMTAPELQKLIADIKDYQARQEAKAKASRESAAAQAAFERRQATSPATPRQVEYILNLLARRARSGEGGGFFNGPTDRAGVAKLSQADASAYINSLTGNY